MVYGPPSVEQCGVVSADFPLDIIPDKYRTVLKLWARAVINRSGAAFVDFKLGCICEICVIVVTGGSDP